jgi:outer membrane protein assembly factor BamA
MRAPFFVFGSFAQALAILCSLSVVAHPQDFGPASGRLKSITVRGAKRFTEQQVIAATGLHIGAPTGVPELEAAAKRLATSGAFENVNYRYRAGNGEIMAEFQVEESSKYLPCVFDNFVWFTPQEIDTTLRRELPLYDGNIPEGGKMVQGVIAALQELLRTRGITSDVVQVPNVDMATGRTVFQFRANGVVLPIRSLSFPGAAAIPEATLHKAAKELIGQDYSLMLTQKFALIGLLPLYVRRGYLRARVLDPRVTLLSPSSADDSPGVALQFPVDEGPEYHWDGVTWTGSHLLAAADLDAKMGLRAGDVADGEKIGAGFEAIQSAYGALGYIQASLRKEPFFDASTQRVRYHVAIEEGSQYRMGAILFPGFSPGPAKRLYNAWKLKHGDVFNASYGSEYLKKEVGKILASEQLRCTSLEMKNIPDPQKKTVDVHISCH